MIFFSLNQDDCGEAGVMISLKAELKGGHKIDLLGTND